MSKITLYRKTLTVSVCLLVFLLAISKYVIADRLSDRLNKIRHAIGQKYKSLDNAITRFKNKEELAWQKQMDIAQAAIEQRNFENAENALKTAQDYAKTFGANNSRLLQTVQVTASCYRQHSDFVHNSLPLLFVPDIIYRKLNPLANKSKDLFTSICVALATFALIGLLMMVGGQLHAPLFDGLLIAFQVAGVRTSLIAQFYVK